MNYLKITYPDINNGLGFRVTLWVAGCSHHCVGCHNSWTWDYNLGEKLETCKDELFTALAQPYIKGLTLSGGDPLAQSDENLKELYGLLLEVREKFPEKDVWLYSGDKIEDVKVNPYKKMVLEQCDYFVDGTFYGREKDLSLAFRGSRNQRIWKKEINEWVEMKLD